MAVFVGELWSPTFVAMRRSAARKSPRVVVGTYTEFLAEVVPQATGRGIRDAARPGRAPTSVRVETGVVLESGGARIDRWTKCHTTPCEVDEADNQTCTSTVDAGGAYECAIGCRGMLGDDGLCYKNVMCGRGENCPASWWDEPILDSDIFGGLV